MAKDLSCVGPLFTTFATRLHCEKSFRMQINIDDIPFSNDFFKPRFQKFIAKQGGILSMWFKILCLYTFVPSWKSHSPFYKESLLFIGNKRHWKAAPFPIKWMKLKMYWWKFICPLKQGKKVSKTALLWSGVNIAWCILCLLAFVCPRRQQLLAAINHSLSCWKFKFLFCPI